MKKFALLFVFSLLLSLTCVFAQENTVDWIRVQSDNGEFSIEIPSKNFNFFFDKDGAMPSQQGGGFYLKNLHLLNSYTDKTLLSFEFYEDSKDTLDQFYESAKINRKDYKSTKTASEIKKNGFSIRQVVEKSKDFYLIRQFFYSKKYIYILTAASRNGETQPMKRFLDSLVFKANTKEARDAKIPSISTLKISPVNVVTENVKPATEDEILKSPEGALGNMFILMAKPRPSYTDAARQNQVQGVIQLRVSFSENGFTPRIEAVKSLPHGLLRQALFAVLRTKFLPEEKNGKAESVDKVIEYSFQIY